LWTATGKRRGAFLPASSAATVAPYAIVVWLVWKDERARDGLREKYRYQSMEARVPPPRIKARPETFQETTALSLERLERECGERDNFRTFLLERLHEQTVTRFIDSPGFGVTRMIQPSEASIDISTGKTPNIPNPGRSILIDSPWYQKVLQTVQDKGALQKMHESSVVDFAFGEGFGFFKDRRHVAGFLSHHFRMLPKVEHWKLEAVDLVSLLLHDPPLAYVSADLPRMDQLRSAPTRSLDLFESEGIGKLNTGQDIFVQQTAGIVRMLGSIRALRQCIRCHDCGRGDLLGAFSYTLLRP
jgi:hypothetical protein